MGGIWGLAASTALENLPVELRGLGSGIIQQGYAAGYLFAAVVDLTLVPHNPHKWRAMFWCGSSLLFFSAIVRAILPESAIFLRAKAAKKELGVNTQNKTRVFLNETKEMLKRHWMLCIYAVLLMAGASFGPGFSVCETWSYLIIGFNFLSHGSQVRAFMGNCGDMADRNRSRISFVGSISDLFGRLERFLFAQRHDCHYHWKLCMSPLI